MCRVGGPSHPLVAAGLAAVVLSAAPVAANAGDMELGAYLASECTSCHQQGGTDHGIPSIVGRNESDFIAAMRAYRSGVRRNPVMRSVATTLSDEDIATLACFFARLRPTEHVQ